MTTNPRIRVREATLADLDAVNTVHFAAFDNDVMSRLMYPNGISEDTLTKARARIFPTRNPEDGTKKGQSFLYVAELLPEDGPADGPGEIIAIAKWVLYPEQRPEEEWKTENFTATVETHGDSADLAVVNAFIGAMNQKQRDLAKGEAALYLSVLACSPNRQRLGAGSALLKWGVDLADSLGLPSRLEASPAGYPLYRKFGYEDVDVLDTKITETWGVVNTDGRNWGANCAIALAGPLPEGVMRTAIMRRPAKKPTA